MRTNVASTSLDAYFAMVAGSQITDGQKAVLAAFARYRERDFTRAELEQVTGLRTGTICGRVNELLAKGLLVQCERRRCSVTGQTAHALRTTAVQQDLFQ